VYRSIQAKQIFLKKRLADDLQSESRKLQKSVEPINFLTQCLYCGLTCDVNHDPKHPDRWREAYMIRTTETQKNSKGYTQYMLDHCSKRGDKWASDVSSRIVGAISDLHAADARYRKKCYSAFFTNRQKIVMVKMSTSHSIS